MYFDFWNSFFSWQFVFNRIFASSEKRLKLDDDGVIDGVQDKLKLMDQKMKQFLDSWKEQTEGVQSVTERQLQGEFFCSLLHYRLFEMRYEYVIYFFVLFLLIDSII